MNPKYRDATPEEQKEWFETNLKPWADKSVVDYYDGEFLIWNKKF